jgi:hypothetical protein
MESSSPSLIISDCGQALPAIAPELDEALEYARAAKSPATRRAYRSDFEIFRTWCETKGLSLPTVHDRAAPLFADTTNLVHCDNCSFVRNLDETDVVSHPPLPSTTPTNTIGPAFFVHTATHLALFIAEADISLATAPPKLGVGADFTNVFAETLVSSREQSKRSTPSIVLCRPIPTRQRPCQGAVYQSSARSCHARGECNKRRRP